MGENGGGCCPCQEGRALRTPLEIFLLDQAEITTFGTVAMGVPVSSWGGGGSGWGPVGRFCEPGSSCRGPLGLGVLVLMVIVSFVQRAAVG